MIVQAIPYPASAGVVIPDPGAFYAYDFTGRPWSVATHPSAFYDSGSDKTFVSWEAQCQFRHVRVVSYSHSTAAWSAPVVIGTSSLVDDDHGVSSLAKLSDGRIVGFYGSHASSQGWSISAQSGGNPNIASWTVQTALSGSYTYPHPVNVPGVAGAGDLYLFLRKRIVSSPVNDTLIVKKASYTSGGAVSFGADTSLVNFDDGTNGGRVYVSDCRYDGSGGIEFCAVRADGADTTRTHVYYFRYVLATGAVENLGGGTSTASGSLPITLTTANTSYRIKTSSGSNETGWVSWLRDASSNIHILYGDSASDPFQVKHDWHNGTAWQGETSLFTVNRKSGTGFVEEWSLVKTSSGVDAYWPDGGTFTGRGGDDIAKRSWASGSWGSQSTIYQGDGVTAIGSPVAVRDADPDLRVAFTQVAQDAIYESRDMFGRFYYGDSGYVEWPEPSDPDLYNNILTLNFEGSNGTTTTTDASVFGNRHAITFNGNAQLATSPAPPWGTSWAKFDGSGDYLSITPALILAGDGDWKFEGGDTLEMVVRPAEIGRTQYLWSTRIQGTNNKGLSFIIDSTNVFKVIGWNGSGTMVVSMSSTTLAAVGTVYKLGIKRLATDGSWALYVNGTQEATNASAVPDIGSSTLLIGKGHTTASNDTTNNYNGYIKQIRFTKLANRDLTVVPTGLFAT